MQRTTFLNKPLFAAAAVCTVLGLTTPTEAAQVEHPSHVEVETLDHHHHHMTLAEIEDARIKHSGSGHKVKGEYNSHSGE